MVRNKALLHTVDLPLPVAPITLDGASIHQPEDVQGTYAIRISLLGFAIVVAQ